jgi:hypothetical protein
MHQPATGLHPLHGDESPDVINQVPTVIVAFHKKKIDTVSVFLECIGGNRAEHRSPLSHLRFKFFFDLGPFAGDDAVEDGVTVCAVGHDHVIA